MMKRLLKNSSIVFLATILLVPSTFLGDQHVRAQESESIEFERASVHDPSIIKVDDTYYVFGSHIAAAKSTDLINWTSMVDREYQTPEDNPIFGNLSENLAESFEWAGEDDADSRGGYAVWAPEIFWNEHYVWDDGNRCIYDVL